MSTIVLPFLTDTTYCRARACHLISPESVSVSVVSDPWIANACAAAIAAKATIVFFVILFSP